MVLLRAQVREAGIVEHPVAQPLLHPGLGGQQRLAKGIDQRALRVGQARAVLVRGVGVSMHGVAPPRAYRARPPTPRWYPRPMPLRTRRVYEPPSDSDGHRILIDRLWPRGVSKEKAAIDYWARDIAPSNELRQWYQHDPAKWDEFRRRYFAELDANPDGVAALRVEIAAADADGAAVTLVFGSREERLNNAGALCAYLEGGEDDRERRA